MNKHNALLRSANRVVTREEWAWVWEIAKLASLIAIVVGLGLAAMGAVSCVAS